MIRVRPACLLLAALLLGAASRPSPAQDEDDTATARWNQYGGNSGRTFSSLVEPVRTVPRVAWKASPSGKPCGDPVAWDGTLYLASSLESGMVNLEAFALADGRRLAKGSLGKTGGSHLAVARGMVVVSDGTGLRGFQLQGNGFTLRWTARGPHLLPPAVLEDTVYACTGGTLNAYDPVTGKVLSSHPLATACIPVVARESGRLVAGGVTTGPLKGYEGRYAFLETIHSLKRTLGWIRRGGEETDAFNLCRIDPEGAAPGGWLLYSGNKFAGKDSDFNGFVIADHGGREDAGLCPISYPPAVRRGEAIGFHADGLLIAVRTDGSYLEVVKKGELPKGARPGPVTRARSVVQFGNWAVDLDTHRVLWCLPELRTVGRLLPVADRVLIACTEREGILCLTDRPEGTTPDPKVPAAAAAPALPALPPPLPGDGLLLEDGTSLEGEVEALKDGKFRVAPGNGEAREEEASGLLLAQGGGKVLHRGRESAVLARWRRTLHPPAVDCLMGIHARLAKDGLQEAAAGVVADARTFGLPDDRAAEATRKAVGVKANAFADRLLRALEPEFRATRTTVRDSFLSASDWCRDRGFPAAATCLLSDACRILPGDPGPLGKVAGLVPAAFPWSRDPAAATRWMEWAREIVDADAEFLPADTAKRMYIDEGPWSRKESHIILRTPNVIFWSRVFDPAVVGRCLRNAEAACRALTVLVGAGEVARVRSDQDRMDVRLHATEADYRAEDGEDGDAVGWSAGSFSPSDGISRFFVPGSEEHDPLGRGLFQVLAHELTHHFLELRWRPTRERRRGDWSDPGFWAVEGIARFVEDQAVEMERRGVRFDDRTAPSLESAAQAAGKKVLFRPSGLLAMSQEDFGSLTTKELLRVRLRNTLEGRILDEIGLFYEQAGATAYFLVMERGEEGRKAFFRYLSDVYAGTAGKDGWKALGFASAEEFDGAVLKFLEGLR